MNTFTIIVGGFILVLSLGFPIWAWLWAWLDRRAERVTAAKAKDGIVRCRDCGIEYSTLGCDLILPDQEWNALCPEGGILCANCICKRASKCGGTALLVWIADFDWALAKKSFGDTNLHGKRIEA